MSESLASPSPVDLRARGTEALKNGAADEAEAAYRTLLGAEPHDIYALVGLGFAARLRGNRGEALQAFRQAAAVWPEHPWPLLEISVELTARSEFDAAETTLRQALQFSPHHFHVLMGLGRHMRRRGEQGQAADFFRTAAQADPAQPSAHLELGQALARLGQVDDAMASFGQALACGAPGTTVLPAQAALLRSAERHDAALACWKAALDAAPQDTALKLELAAEAEALGRYDEIRAASEAVIADESIPEKQRHAAALKAGQLARRGNNAADAIMFLEYAARLDPDDMDVCRTLADLCRASNRFPESERFYRQALAVKPTDLAALGGLAIVRRQLGDSTGALALFDQAASIDPRNDWIGFERGITLRDMGLHDDARAILEAIDAASSMHYWARMTLGHMARAAGARRLALDYFEQAAATAGNPIDPLHQIASEKRALGDLAGAEAVIGDILARDPDSHSGHMARAYLKRAVGDFAAARAGFARAAALAPAQPQPHVELAFEARRNGDLAAAMESVEAALRANPHHEDALLKKALLLTDLGEVYEALAIYGQLRAAVPNSPWGYLEAAQLLSEQGNLAAARGLLATARSLCPATSSIGLREAAILRRHGFLDEAFAVLNLVHARYPSELWPWLSRATAATDIGLYDLADALLSAPPGMAAQDRVHVLNARAQLDKACWRLDDARAGMDAALAIDPANSQTLYERAKLKLLGFDLAGAYSDLEAHSTLQAATAQREGRSAHPSQSHAGQLYEEFVLSPRLAAALAAAQSCAPAQRIAKFAELVRTVPDSTGPAIGLMIALRQNGRLVPEPVSGAAPGIPRLITQFWTDPAPPPDIQRIMDSWHAAEPDCRIELFDDTRAAAYLRAHFPPEVARAYGLAEQPAQRADLFRLARLSRDGGYYLDADDRARGGLTAHTPPGVAFFAYQEELGTLGNNILGAVPGHPVFALALPEAVEAIMRDDRDIVWLSTGPALLTRAFARWLTEDAAEMDAKLASTAILTLAEMRRAAAMFCHAAYKTTNRAWLNAAFAKRQRG